MSKGKGVAGRVWQAFKDRWQIGSHYSDYLPPTKGPTAYRTPSPGSQPVGDMSNLHRAKELEYNTTYFKRRDIQLKVAPGFPPGYGADGSLPPGVEVPPHSSIPRWMRNPKDVQFIKKFKDQTGLTLLGRYPVPQVRPLAMQLGTQAPSTFDYNRPIDWRDDTRDYLLQTVYRNGAESPFRAAHTADTTATAAPRQD